MKNNEFDSKINEELHKQNLELIKENTEIASASLKVLITIVDLISNLSVTTIPKIGIEVAKLAVPLQEAALKIIESKKKQLETLKTIPDIKKEIELPDLNVENPITIIKSSEIQKLDNVVNTNIANTKQRV